MFGFLIWFIVIDIKSDICLVRFNIAADLVAQAKDAGELGFAGILMWMRFMATRQLIWNKNYNVKPRYDPCINSFMHLKTSILLLESNNFQLLLSLFSWLTK